MISDVDGTLVTDDKVLTERARTAAAELRAAGIAFSIISQGVEKAGLSIAMGNAGPEVKRAAGLVTGSNAEDGFAAALERFILAPRRDQ